MKDFVETDEKTLKQGNVTNSTENFAEFVQKAKSFIKNTMKFADDAIKIARAWYAQPKATVAVVKFQKVDGSILYEARYTNCTIENKLAEDFFEEDIKSRIFKEMVEWNPNGTVTLYLRPLHPFNKSTGEERENTEEGEDNNEGEDTNEKEEGAEESKSSCAILKRIVSEILRENGSQIKLLVKAINLDLLRKEDGTLHERAATEIKDLMRIEGVNVSEMTHKDWHYLFWMTKEFSNRQVLDRKVQDIFDQIHRINLL